MQCLGRGRPWTHHRRTEHVQEGGQVSACNAGRGRRGSLSLPLPHARKRLGSGLLKSAGRLHLCPPRARGLPISPPSRGPVQAGESPAERGETRNAVTVAVMLPTRQPHRNVQTSPQGENARSLIVRRGRRTAEIVLKLQIVSEKHGDCRVCGRELLSVRFQMP